VLLFYLLSLCERAFFQSMSKEAWYSHWLQASHWIMYLEHKLWFQSIIKLAIWRWLATGASWRVSGSLIHDPWFRDRRPWRWRSLCAGHAWFRRSWSWCAGQCSWRHPRSSIAEEALDTGAARAGFEVIDPIVNGDGSRKCGIIDVDHFDGEDVGAVAVARCGAAFGHWQRWIVAIIEKIQLPNTEMYIWVFLSTNANTNRNTFEKCIWKY